jgi:uncharacterized protein YwlG (UPF0340 family)
LNACATEMVSVVDIGITRLYGGRIGKVGMYGVSDVVYKVYSVVPRDRTKQYKPQSCQDQNLQADFATCSG